IVSNEWIPYLKVLEKFNNMRKDNKDLKANVISTRALDNKHTIEVRIVEEKNIEFFDYLVSKLKMPIYQKMKGNKAAELSEKGYGLFKKMSLRRTEYSFDRAFKLINKSKNYF
ncbi:MAG: CRISPR-associated protein, Csn1 family, partial [Veillonella dispar DORA_11]